MNDRYEIRLSVFDKRTGKDWHSAITDSNFSVFSDRVVDDFRMHEPSAVGSFEEAVCFLKKRQFRRDILNNAARFLANHLGDHIEDSEGWHGEERREIIKAAQPKEPTQ